MRSFCSLPLLAVVFLSLLPISLSAQSKENWAPRRFVGETLSVDVDVVDVYFTVRKHNKFVENLTRNDFEIRENNRKQDIRYFSSESQARLSLGVLIDTSDSESPMLHSEREIARRFFNTVLAPGDEGLVASFDSNIQIRQDFTGDHESLVKAIELSDKNSSERSRSIDPGPMPKDRSTALYDAIVGISEHRFADRRGRNAVIIITDGQDAGSRATAKQAINAALKANAICYVLLVGDKGYMSSTSYVGGERMRYLAGETGGRVVVLDQKLKGLESSLLEIAAELRHHYSIGYSPEDRNADGAYRRLSIRSHHGYQVHSRRGYFYVPREPNEPEASLLGAASQ